MKRKTLTLVMGVLFLPGSKSWADYYFNPSFINQGNKDEAVADLSDFEHGDGIPAGVYPVDVYLNGNNIADSQKVSFKKDNRGEVKPFFSLTELQSFGINTNAAAEEKLNALKNKNYFPLQELLPDASVSYSANKQKLELKVPQLYLNSTVRGYVPPEQWQEGINALLFSYNFTGSKDWYKQENNQDSNFLSLQSGLNLGKWRLRDNSSWSYNHSAGGDTTSVWRHINTFLERDISFLKGELKAGDTSTSSDMFDAITFRGVQLASDDNMLPDSQKGFAPTVRGIAKSNARVTISQNGFVLYQTYVPAGAFKINDLFPTSSSGDLNVTVDENDGTSHQYTIPYSAVPLMQREGHIEYEFDAGRFRDGGNSKEEPEFFQSNLEWGWLHGTTLYGGAQLASRYHAWVFGVGRDIGDLGAISVDLTRAESTLADDSEHIGESLRFLYSKSLNKTGTTFQILGYRYSTAGFYTFQDTTYKAMSGYNNNNEDSNTKKEDDSIYQQYYNLYYTKKGKIQLSINQSLNGWGDLYFTGSQQSYWHTDEHDTTVQAGYSGDWKGISYSVAYTYNKSAGQSDADKQISFNASIPFDFFLGEKGTHNAYVDYTANTDTHGAVTHSVGLNGTLLDDNSLNYNLQQGYTTQGSDYNGTVSLDYKGEYNKLDAGYNYNADMKEVNYGISGGAVIHHGGITFSQPLGTTNALVSAPGASDINVIDNAGVKTDWRGYAVVPYVSTYRHNRIALDTRSLGRDVDLDNASVDVVPTEGALVQASFNPHIGARTIMTIMHNGKPLPFGALVKRPDGESAIVGDDGQTYLSGLPQKGMLEATWGNDDTAHCHINYQLSDAALKRKISYSQAVCL